MIDKYGLNTVILDDEISDAYLVPYFARRYGPGIRAKAPCGPFLWANTGLGPVTSSPKRRLGADPPRATSTTLYAQNATYVPA